MTKVWRGFASDNYAGVHPDVMAAIVAVNEGHQVAYGADTTTEQLDALAGVVTQPTPAIRRQHAGGRLHRGQQGICALCKAAVETFQRLAHALHHGGTAVLVCSERTGPVVGHVSHRGLEARGNTVQLRMGGCHHLLAQARGVSLYAGHGALHGGLDAFACELRAAAEAVAQGLVHGAGQIGINGFHIRMEAFLVGQQAGVELLTHAFHLGHHGLHLVHHFGQGLRLQLQRLVGFLALVDEREARRRARLLDRPPPAVSQRHRDCGARLVHRALALTAAGR